MALSKTHCFWGSGGQPLHGLAIFFKIIQLFSRKCFGQHVRWPGRSFVLFFPCLQYWSFGFPCSCSTAPRILCRIACLSWLDEAPVDTKMLVSHVWWALFVWSDFTMMLVCDYYCWICNWNCYSLLPLREWGQAGWHLPTNLRHSTKFLRRGTQPFSEWWGCPLVEQVLTKSSSLQLPLPTSVVQKLVSEAQNCLPNKTQKTWENNFGGLSRIWPATGHSFHHEAFCLQLNRSCMVSLELGSYCQGPKTFPWSASQKWIWSCMK